MAVILDDTHLENLQCSQCHKYLSLFPIKNHSSRSVTCGRCCIYNDEGVRSTLFELIAEKHLFRCINRYEGCRKLLRTNETEAHEKECVGNIFYCPKCLDGTGRSMLELIWHYKLQHPSSYLKKNYFSGKPPSNDAMLYIQDDTVFVILLRYSLNVLCVNAVTLTDSNATKMFFVISQGAVFNKSERKCCKSINAFDADYFTFTHKSGQTIEIIFNLEVLKPAKPYDVPSSMSNYNKLEKTKQFMIQLQTIQCYTGYQLNDTNTSLITKNGVQIDLTCSHCWELIGSPIYKCHHPKHEAVPPEILDKIFQSR